MNATKLRRVISHLKRIMPNWTWRVLTRKEVEELGTTDPPIAMIRGSLGPFHVNFHGDGEVWFEWIGDTSTDVLPSDRTLDPSTSPLELAYGLLDVLSSEGRGRGREVNDDYIRGPSHGNDGCSHRSSRRCPCPDCGR